MNTIKYFALTILLQLTSITCFAQQLEIVSPLSHAGSVGAASVPTDNNGNPCAKIIVDVPIEDAVIEGTYIVGNVKEKAGRYEFYVSVPKKNGQKFSVRHSNYGSIEIPLWKDNGSLVAREAYIVKLKATSEEKVIVDMHGNKIDVENKKVEVIVHDDAGGQYLVMTVSPSDASVEIDGQFVSVKDGMLQKLLSYGSHSYRVYHPMYEEKTGSIVINNEKVTATIKLRPMFGFIEISSSSKSGADVYIDGNKVGSTPYMTDALQEGLHTVKVAMEMYEPKEESIIVGDGKTVSKNFILTPTFGFLQISSSPEIDADVYIDGKKVGSTPYKTDALQEGSHTIRVIKNMYEPKEESVAVKRGETTSVKLDMKPTFGNITIYCADQQATIMMNGRTLATGSWSGKLERGRYQIETQRQNHRTTSKIIDVEANTTIRYDLEAPSPIVGSLNITSDPIGAGIKVDGKDMGETPNIINGLLIGSHTVSLSKQGCGDYENTITIEEGKITPLDATLERGKEITFTTDKLGDQIYIDDTLAGTTPLTTSLSFGSHTVYAKRGDNKTETETVNVTATTTSNVSLSFAPMIGGHEFVDLGLPSGLKWATCNVGATKPEDYGDYFAWGETMTKSDYADCYSATYGNNNTWLKRNGYIDSRGNLTKAHDAASANWGSTWRMPTAEEIIELVENTTTEWTARNGVKGRLVKSKRNGNSIFIPAAGYRDGASLDNAGWYGRFWSSTPSESNAYKATILYFFSDNFRRAWNYRYCGLSVRPVSK